MIAAAALVHGRALQGAFVYDDALLVVSNPRLHDPSWPVTAVIEPLWGAEQGYWRPLTGLLLAAGYRLGAGGPLVLHALSLLLHLGATAVAFAMVRRLCGNLLVAAVASLLFALHPVQVESVAWIAAINDPLWGLLGLCALRAQLAWRARGSPGVPWAPALWSLAAMLAKEPAVVVPAAVLWLDVARRTRADAGAATRPVAPQPKWPLLLAEQRPEARGPRCHPWLLPSSGVSLRADQSRRGRSALRAYGPLALAVLLWLALRVLVFGRLDAGFGRDAVETGLSAARAGLLRIELLARSCELLCLPLAPDLFRDVALPPGPRAIAPALCALLLACGFALAWRRGWHAAAFGLGLVPLALLPGLVRPEGLGAYPLADRYLYFAAFGFATAAAWLLVGPVPMRRAPLAALVCAAAAVGWYGWTSAQRIAAWSSQRALIEAGLRAHPDNPQLWQMRGHELLVQRGAGDTAMLDAACAAFARAAELLPQPRYAGPALRARLEVDVRLGRAWCTLAREELVREPRFDAVQREFAAIAADHPASANAQIGLGHASAKAGDFARAEAAFSRAVELDPLSAHAHRSLGWFHATLGRPARARPHLEAALRLQPDDAVAQRMLSDLPR